MEKDKALFTTNTNGNRITQRSEDFGMTSHDFHSFNSHESGFVFAQFLDPPLPQKDVKRHGQSQTI